MRFWTGVVTAVVPGLGAAAVSAAGLGLVLAVMNGRSGADLVRSNLANNVVLAVGYAVVAVLVLRAAARHRLGWVFLVVALLNAGTVLGTEWAVYTFTTRPGALPWGGPAAWLGSYLWWPAFLLQVGAIPLLYPDGQLPSRRWRPVGILAAAAMSVAVVAAAVWTDLLTDSFPGRGNPLARHWLPVDLPSDLAVTGLLISAGCGLAGIAAIAVRMRRSSGPERGRLAWFLAAMVPLIVVLTLVPNQWATLAAVAFIPVALGVAMVRHGLYDGDRVLNRTLVYTVLTALIVAVFATFVGWLGNSLGGNGTGAVAAAVVVALGLDPARRSVQHGVDRLLYGRRPDSYAALIDFGHRLTDAVTPHEVLPDIVHAVAVTMRLPYVAVHLGDDQLPAAGHGTAPATTVDLRLWHAGRPVGSLVVGVRAGRDSLDPVDQRLLDDVLPHLGAAVHAARLTDDLRRSHARLAFARDQERHRIRRDLHDGLGPTLAGLALGLGAARRSVAGRPETARLLAELHDEVQQCLVDVRWLVAQMHPTPPTGVGLLEALRQHAFTVSERSGAALTVTVRGPEVLPALLPETELAAYRIAMVAITNVARHARAGHCRVEVGAGAECIELLIEDDGVGIENAGSRVTPGLGLRSMLERAQELGGDLRIRPRPGGGTTVTTALPLGRP
ncbi:histidine kinase [Actinoplanes sp. NBC_00393]|uniref:sensor histidine kinase n=1 Tax=Actinoplanes sp. NBC_00393 TaxID=2975953 RepID=UPI002E1C9C91